MDGSTYVEYMKIALVCVMWYLCSASDNIIGKVVLSDFPYPMTMTMIQLLTTSVFLAPFLPCVGATKKGQYDRRYFFVMILPLAFGKFISSVSSYISIWRVSVSYAHTVKATLPLFTVILAKLILGENQILTVYFSLIPIITGVGVATMTEASFDSVGLASALTATLCFSLLTIFTKKCLKETGYNHLQLLVLISRIATACFLPFWALADLPRIIHNTEFLNSGKVIQTMVLLFCDGLFNMMHNVFAFTVLALVAPLSYAVANATKRIVIISGSILILQNSVTPMNAIGMLIAVFGVLCYNKAKYDQHQLAKRQQILPLVHSDSELHHHGISHMPHSKSDANFLKNGGIAHLNGTSPPPLANGHILLRDWQGSDEGITLIPVASHTPTEPTARGLTPVSSSQQVQYGNPSSRLHSRSVHHV
ncbi:solute carrier family 35 member E1 homolog [Littorina saxatilis]|uniref:solute carrier family 35 member E1 homolog n=1 Tax=Littorina saxatilis TaxID=31220 RepID=UPI0038B59028